MNTTHLIGSEQVERAGHNIQGAAETMRRAASEMDNSIERMGSMLDQHAERIEAAMASLPTLRDHFAAKALQGILGGDHPITHDTNPEPLIASVAYTLADAMMKAREA